MNIMHALNTMQAMLKVYISTCTCVLHVCHERITLQCKMFCAHADEYAQGMNPCMETIHGTSVDRLS